MSKVTTTLLGTLPFLPYQAEVPVSEKYQFFTDLIEHEDGTEQATSLRTIPKQTFEYSIPLQYWKKADAFNSLYPNLANNWLVPIWTESQFVGSIAFGQTTLSVNTEIVDIKAPSVAMLYSAWNVWQIVEIESLTDSSITFGATTSAQSSAFLVPLKEASLKGSANLFSNGREGLAKLEFEIKDVSNITSGEQTQYKGYDVVLEEWLRGSRNFADRTLQTAKDINDFGIGDFSQSTSWKNAKYTSVCDFILDGLSEVRTFKEFLFRTAGKSGLFWMPTFENDIRKKQTGLITTTLLVESDSILDYASQRKEVAIQDAFGNWLLRSITNFEQVAPATVRLTLSTSVNVLAENIYRISYLSLCRLDSDIASLEWVGNSVAKSQLRITEIST